MANHIETFAELHCKWRDGIRKGEYWSIQAKTDYHRKGKKFFKEVANVLQLEEYDVRSCKGGDAVMGEVILHTPNFYINCSINFPYARTCKGMKDYVGGRNIQIPSMALTNVDTFIAFLKDCALIP